MNKTLLAKIKAFQQKVTQCKKNTQQLRQDIETQKDTIQQDKIRKQIENLPDTTAEKTTDN